MKVKEFIQELSKLDQELDVLSEGLLDLRPAIIQIIEMEYWDDKHKSGDKAVLITCI